MRLNHQYDLSTPRVRADLTGRRRQRRATIALPLFLIASASSGEGQIVPWDETTVLDSEPPRTYAEFGTAVAVSGRFAVIGAPMEPSTHIAGGAVYVVDLELGFQRHRLLSDDIFQNDRFGEAVGVDGNVAIIGAPGVGGTSDTGAAYLFEIEQGLQFRKLLPERLSNRSGFGSAVALEGSLAVIGAPNDLTGGFDPGCVYVFDSRTGGQLARLVGDPTEDRGFGTSIALHRETLVVGHPNDDEVARDAGAVYIFEDPVSGEPPRKIVASDGAVTDYLGTAVDISDAFIVAGAPRHAAFAPDAGAVYVFDLRTGERLYKFTPSDPVLPLTYFGTALALDGGTSIIGSYLGASAGSAYVLDVANALQQWDMLPTTGGDQQYFAAAVSLERDTIVIGAPTADVDGTRDAGLAYHYRRATPRLEVMTTDRCPGPLTVDVRHATPGGTLRIFYGETIGAWQELSGACPQTYLSLHPPFEPFGPAQITADANGQARFSIDVPTRVCNRLALQVIDLTSCTPSRLLHIESGAGLLTITPTPLLAGEPVTFDLTSLTPEAPVWMLYSLTGIDPNGTPITALNVVVDLASPQLAWGPRLAATDGTLTVTGLVPVVGSDRDIWFQGAQEERITSVVETRLLRQ